jgi:hypothetical protein
MIGIFPALAVLSICGGTPSIMPSTNRPSAPQPTMRSVPRLARGPAAWLEHPDLMPGRSIAKLTPVAGSVQSQPALCLFTVTSKSGSQTT